VFSVRVFKALEFKAEDDEAREVLRQAYLTQRTSHDNLMPIHDNLMAIHDMKP